jgi:hypothetical protein
MTASADVQAATAARPRQRIPDFFIVGHHKCGTTALYEMLRSHPQVFMPEIKEPWFFADDLTVRYKPTTRLPSTLDEYCSLFAAAGPRQRAGEATPSYLFSRSAARSIAAVQPRARIIAILREPASFLRSLHMQTVKNHAETETDLRKALALEERRRRGEAIPPGAMRPQELLYSEHVRYVEQLRRYHACFPAEQILVIIYEDFRRDNEATLRRVLRFLEVDDSVAIAPVEVNPTVRVRSQRLYMTLRSLYMGYGPLARGAKAVIKTLVPGSARRKANLAVQQRLLYGSPRPADEELIAELQSRFKGEVVALSEYLGIDLVRQWGYEHVE